MIFLLCMHCTAGIHTAPVSQRQNKVLTSLCVIQDGAGASCEAVQVLM